MRIIAMSDITGPAWIVSAHRAYPVGAAFLGHELEIQVHPASRRQGVGTMLLEAAVAEARRLGKRSMRCPPVPVGSAGDHFLAARGLRPALLLTYTRLDLRPAPPRPAPVPGYRLVGWEGLVPDDLAVSFAASRRAMDDMPTGETDAEPETWDVERVRQVTAVVTERGDRLETMAAVHEATGEIVAFTELVVPGAGTGDGQHYGTGVLPEHRGRGLARWMKAGQIARIRQRHPGVDGLLADTADGNAPMRRINDSLGYRPTHRAVLYQWDADPHPADTAVLER
jgi:GNAT superfamily N-acetyltransferase